MNPSLLISAVCSSKKLLETRFGSLFYDLIDQLRWRKCMLGPV